jgi:hypothetical protein
VHHRSAQQGPLTSSRCEERVQFARESVLDSLQDRLPRGRQSPRIQLPRQVAGFWLARSHVSLLQPEAAQMDGQCFATPANTGARRFAHIERGLSQIEILSPGKAAVADSSKSAKVVMLEILSLNSHARRCVPGTTFCLLRMYFYAMKFPTFYSAWVLSGVGPSAIAGSRRLE